MNVAAMEREGGGVPHINNPFPRDPKTLKFVTGQLFFDAEALPSKIFATGKNFEVSWDSGSGSLTVFHRDEPERALWATPPGGGSFVSAARGEENVEESRGSYALHDQIDIVCNHQTVEKFLLSYPGDKTHAYRSFSSKTSSKTCTPLDKSTCVDADWETLSTPGSNLDADGTVLDKDGPSLIITGSLYTDAELARNQLRLSTQAVGDEGPCDGRRNRKESKRSAGFDDWKLSVGVRYRLVFTELREHHLGFEVLLDAPENLQENSSHNWDRQEAFEFLHEQKRDEVDMDLLSSNWHKIHMQLQQLPDLRLWSKEPDRPAFSTQPFLGLRHRNTPTKGSGRVEVKSGWLSSKWSHIHTRLQQLPALWLWSKEPRSAFSAQPFLGFRHSRWRESGFGIMHSWSTIPAFRTLRNRYKSLKSGYSSNIVSLLRDQQDVQIPYFNRIQLTYMSHKGERFFGFGEQFSFFDMKGKRVPIMVQEQGLGRGDQPITAAANLVAHRAGGDWHTTYAPSPHYMTSDMNSLYLEGYEHAIFDLTRHNRVQVQVHAGTMKGRILHGRTPAELIEQYTAAIGRMRALPAWITKGAIVGMQGGHDAVRNVWQKLQDYDVPLSAFWLQDWVGQRKTSIGWQLWWNWEVDTDHYPEWEHLVQDLSSRGVRTMTYCNPFIVPTDEKLNRRSNHFDDAVEEGYIVGDSSGAPYMIPNTSFNAAMVDLTNPAARKWLKGIMYNMVKTGVRGWMADFGESLPFDSCLFSGEDPSTAHNKYPEMWAELNREVVEEWEQELKNLKNPKRINLDKESHEGAAEDDDDDEDQLVFFMRAGYRGSPKSSTLFWAGDQMVSWQRHDGIKSAVTGLLTSGLSGYAFNHSDIGGYCTVDFPFLRYRRSEELLLRWMELNAFSVIFRTHEGNVPGANTQFYSNQNTFAHFARCAKMYKAWEFYRRQLVKEAAATGMPVVRHLFLHYPHDENVQRLIYEQFLVGCEILVVPVLDKGRTRVQAYFPPGDTWEHIWTGLLYRAPTSHGFRVWIQTPIGFPALFVKKGSPIGVRFMTNLINGEILKKRFLQDS